MVPAHFSEDLLHPRRLLATVALIPLAAVLTACGGVGEDWANETRTAADSPVGNDGAPNTGISADDLAERVEKADRETRSVRTEFDGDMYGVALSGDAKVTKNGDTEAHYMLSGKEMELRVVGGTEYYRLDPGTYAALFEMYHKSPSYDSGDAKEEEDFLEFAKLVEGKYLKEEADDDDGGLQTFDGLIDEGPFAGDGSGDGGGSDDDEDSYDEDYDDDDGDDTEYTLGEITHVNGIEVIPLIATAEDDDTTYVTTSYIPTHGTPLPVRVTFDENDDDRLDGSLDLRYFTVGDEASVAAPPKEETVDMGKAMGGLFGGLDGGDDDGGSPATSL